MDPGSSVEKIAGYVSVNDVTCHFWFQISNLTSEMNLIQRMTTS